MALTVILCIVFFFVCIVDIYLVHRSLRLKTKSGKALAITCFGAFSVTFSYLLSIFVTDYFTYSLLSSLYFAGISASLVSLAEFIRVYTYHPETKFEIISLNVLRAYMVFDVAVLLSNPFTGIAVDFLKRDTIVSHYTYSMKPLFTMHLVYSYCLIALILFLIIKKMMVVPKIYRTPYLYIILSFIAVVLINAAYLYLPAPAGISLLDYSLLGYSIVAISVYWSAFVYSSTGLLKEFRNWIFEELGQGLLLFDYDDHLVLKNEIADNILPDAGITDGMTIEEFIYNADFKGKITDVDHGTYQNYVKVGESRKAVRYDYSVIRDESRAAIGKLFVITDLAGAMDPLTGFHAWSDFSENVPKIESKSGTPPYIVVCDINGLTNINKTFGQINGSRAIQIVSDIMRSCMPEGSYFVRGREANLAAICSDSSLSDLNSSIDELNKKLAEQKILDITITVQTSIIPKSDSETLTEAILRAIASLGTKKLLDNSTRHSESIRSLVQALQECDSDTEAHVRRTQRLCSSLSKHMGLSDEDKNNLSLLAVLHDIGKIGIPLDILNKPSKLSESEWAVLKTHTDKGYQIAKSSPELNVIAEMILYHHERWDGKGYPDGLSKESIPLLSRIIAVVDAYDAMINDRSYRKKMSKTDACSELIRCAGSQFDPSVVTQFVEMLKHEDAELGDFDLSADHAASEVHSARAWSEDKESFEPSSNPDTLRVHPLIYSKYILDEDQIIVSADKTFEHFTGYTPEEAVELKLTQFDLIFDEDRDGYIRMVEEHSKDELAFFEHRIRRKNGRSLYVFCMGKKYYDSSVRKERTEIVVCDSNSSYAVQAIVKKVKSKATKRLEQWENKFRRDSLTGLLNHEAFRSDVEERLLNDEKSVMMLMIDVDNFKKHNDTHGHRSGDELLVVVSQSIMSSLRDEDLACRMGGDEFAAVIFFRSGVSEDTMIKRAREICEKINMTLSSTYLSGASVSIGGAFLSEENNSFTKLYEAADKALYKSKENGKARFSV